MARLKSPAQPAPQTLEEALALLGRYARLSGNIARLEGARDRSIAQLVAKADAAIAPAEAELRELVKQLKPWWAVSRKEFTDDGKRKSAKLGGCEIGHRLSTPSLTYMGKVPKKGSDEEKAAIALLRLIERADLVRIKLELDRPAILTALKDPVPENEVDPVTGAALGELGFASRQTEQFFVDRLPPKPAAVEEVPDPEAGVVA